MRPWLDSLVEKIHWKRDRLPTPVFLVFFCGSAGKEPPAMWETWVWSPGWEDTLEKGKTTHSSILAWRIPWNTVHGVTRSQTQLSNFHFTHCFCFHGFEFSLSPLWASLVAQRLKRLPAVWETWVRSLGREDPLKKEMATYSRILAWRIPWMEEPGRFTGLQRVGHDWVTSLTHSLPCYNSLDLYCIDLNEVLGSETAWVFTANGSQTAG